MDVWGERTPLHEVAVGETLKGDAPEAETIDVAVMPVTCMSGEVGDPLDAEGELLLFLWSDSETGMWLTLTPAQGVLPVADRDRLVLPD